MTTASGLRSVVTDWSDFPRIGRHFQPRRTLIAAKKVAERFGDVQPQAPSSEDIETLYQRVVASWERHGTIDGLSARDLRRLPWVFFYSPTTVQHIPNDWLGAKPPLVRAYRRWLSDRSRPRSLLALLHEFLRFYPADLPTFDDLRRLLQKSIDAEVAPSLRVWKDRCRDFGLLDVDGDTRFIRKLLSTDWTVHNTLQRAGLAAPDLTRGEFLRSGTRKYLGEVHALLTKRDAVGTGRLDPLIEFLEFENSLRFDERSVRVEIAQAFLGPFTNERPPAEIEDWLRPFFLRRFGDPRLRSGKSKWARAPNNVTHVLMRRLVKQTLDDFIRLIEQTALDTHWRYREAFWMAFFRRGMIEDAWFILGAQATSLLKRISKQGESTTGTLRGAGRDQPVLLLKMRGVIVAEWSHNGTCRIWRSDKSSAPVLYRNVYHRSDLTPGSDFSQRHVGNDAGRWQDKAARWMGEPTRVFLDRREYFHGDGMANALTFQRSPNGLIFRLGRVRRFRWTTGRGAWTAPPASGC